MALHFASRRGASIFLSIVAIAMFCVLVSVAAGGSRIDTQSRSKAFTESGIQIGEQLPDLPVIDLDGKEHGLGDAWSGRPVLLLTSSYSCPKSRAGYPGAEALAASIVDRRRLGVVIVYVLEAHPKGDPSPYVGVEDVTAENRRDGILCRQPRTLKDRLALANRFKDRLHVKIPIYVDPMSNAVWSQLGGGPNMGVLVDRGGIVVAKQSWFDAPSMQKAIDAFLAAAPNPQREDDVQSPDDRALTARLKSDGFQSWSLSAPFEKGDIPAAKELLDRCPHLVGYTDEWSARGGVGGKTMLDYAVEGGHADMVNLLLAKGAEVNAQNAHVPSALHLAAAKGDPAIVGLLIDHGAKVNLKAVNGSTPIQEAAINGHREVVELLLSKGATQNVFSYSAIGDVAAVRKALEQDATRAVRPDGSDRTPLDYAAAAGQIEVVKLLFSYGVKDHFPANTFPRDLALHWAARHKQAVMVEFLLSSGDDPNSRGMYFEIPLCIATEQNDVPTFKALLAHKANLQELGTAGWAALHIAARDGLLALGQRLIDSGADVNVRDAVGYAPCGPFGAEPPLETPLHLAAQAGQIQFVKLLLAHGATVDARTNLGLTPLHAALQESDDEQLKQNRSAIVATLLGAGAEVNAADKQGRTPLDLATVLKDESILKMLKDRGARVGKPVVDE